MAEPSRPRPVLRRALLALTALAVSLLSAEVGWRLYRRAGGAPYDAAAVRERLRGFADQATTNLPVPGVAEGEEAGEWRTGLHPFLAFDALRSLEQVRADELYFRTPAAERSFDVVVLGGSVAASYGFQAGPVFARLLERAPGLEGRPVRVLTYARAAHKQPQQAIALTWLLSLGIRPDLVLNLDGFNEVAQSNVNAALDTNPAYPSIAQWSPFVGGVGGPEEVDLLLDVRATQNAAGASARRWADSPLVASAVGGELALRLVGRARARMVRAQKRYVSSRGRSPFLRGPEFDAGRDAVLARGVRTWVEGSRALRALCDANGVLYLHALQPTLHDGVKAPTDEERASGTASGEWMEAVEHGYPLLRAAGAELAGEGVAFVDLTDVYAEEAGTIYVDACHVNERGNALMARRLARACRRRFAAQLGAPADGPR